MIRQQNSQIKHLAQPQTTQQPAKVQPVQQPVKVVQVSPPRPCLGFILSWAIFILAVGVYAGIWAIANFAVPIQTSYYYNVDHAISPYILAQSNPLACDSQVSYRNSSAIYTADEIKTVQAVALYLVFSWLMWKLPMALFMLHLIFQASNRIIKYVTWGVVLMLMLAADIVLTIFIPTIYQQYMFYAFAALLTVIVSVINNRTLYKQALAASFLPLFFIAFLYFSYTYFIPALYDLMYTFVTDYGYMYLIIYGYPVLDFIFYAMLLLLNAKCALLAKPLLSFVQYFLLGYFCGITMLVSVTEVQFYYLCAYMLFRNFFTNWVMWKWQGVVNNPPCLPGWAIVYYLSYLFNFLPLYGIGALTVSKSFYSTQFAQSCLLIYYYPVSEYPYSTSTPTSGYNLSMQGYVFWPAALIIWVLSTATQKYQRRMPTLFDFFYSMAGIYMFYIGISAGLELLVLRQVAFKT